MELNPERRYSSMRELHNDLEVAYKRISEGDTGADLPLDTTSTVAVAKGPSMEGLSRTVMLIDSNTGMQDLLRDKLKQHGYRVLIVSHPDRGLARFTGTQHVADCVIFSALDLGMDAVEAFNRFGDDDVTRDMPAILILDQKQQHLAQEAKLAPHRVSLSMPIKVKELRLALMKLFQLVEADSK
jgi:CheY-like chemotaxis protein